MQLPQDENNTEVTIKWKWNDIKTMRPNWTEDQCEEFLFDNRKSLQDRSIEIGWDIIAAHLPPEEEGEGA